MRTRLLYSFLAVGVLALVVIGVYLTNTLVDMASVRPAPSALVPASSVLPSPETTSTPKPVDPSVERIAAAPVPVPVPPRVIPPVQDPPVITEAQDTTPKPAVAPDSSAVKNGVGSIILILGTVHAVDAKQSRRPLAAESRVAMQDRIETAPQSRLKILFDDRSVLSVGESSAMVIDEYVYNPAEPKTAAFSTRLIKGVFRYISGLIVEANPDRVNVRTKMATCGIRGCDIGFRTTELLDEITLLELGTQNGLRVKTTTDGSTILNTSTGSEMPVEEAKRKVIEMKTSNTRVTIAPGRAPEESRISGDEARKLVSECSVYQPARIDLRQTPDGTKINLRPLEPQGTNAPVSSK